MSELKRVSFTTLSGGSIDGISSSVSSKKTNISATAAALFQGHDDIPSTSTISSTSISPGPVTSQQQASKTLRLDLELAEPTSDFFPEFNYLKLVHLEKKKLKKLSKLNGFSDGFDESDDVARIARELEKKYGSAYGGGRRKSKKDDYCDKGAGYDESDTFIDNTEAYDEIIPEEMETVEGGFYINSGVLQFKHLSNYERTDDIAKLPKAKKRALSSSSSSEDDSEDEDEAEVETEGNSSPKETGSTISTASKLKNGHMDKKPKVVNEGSDKEGNTKVKNKDKKVEKVKRKDELREENTCLDSGKEKDKEKTVKTTTVKDMLKAKRDNFRKRQEGEGKVKLTNGEEIKGTHSGGESSQSSTEDSDSDDEPSEKKFKKIAEDDTDKLRTNDVKLSDDIPSEILRDINAMITTATPGKGFHFDDEITEIFLRIDDSSLCLDKSIRNQIFAHLEYKLSLPKYFLLRRAKQMRIKEEKNKTKKAYLKLRKAVAEIMPSVLLTYEANCRKVDEIKSKISPAELEQMEHQPKYPRKRFPWTDTLRNLLYELYQVRWTSFTVLRTRKETFEEFVESYLRDKVVAIWPPGWMRYDDLKKELEKRKEAAKKPKENKKPGELSIVHKNKLNSETSITVVEKSPELIKSVLSTNNTMSVVSTKDLVVTIATKSIEKPSEVPHTSAQSNSVSITQIPIDSTSNNKERNSPIVGKSDCSQSQKPFKSTVSNVNSSTTNSLPLQIESSHIMSKGMSQNSNCTGNNFNKNSTKSSTDKTSNNNSSNSVNNHNNTVMNSTTSKGPIDLNSPTKRATDHSINSIMSSNSPLSIQHSSITTGIASTSIPAGQNKVTDPPTTHIITVDNLKNTSDIINTTNQLLNNNNGANNCLSNANSGNGSKDCSIRVRTVANVNSSVEKDLITNTYNKVTQESSDKDSGSESDGVEIVGVYPVVAKKSTTTNISKNKCIKNKNTGSRDSSPVQHLPKQNQKNKVPSNEGRGSVERMIISSEIKDPDLDMNQIMRSLKELEEMQQSSIHIWDGSPLSSSSRSVTNSHTSSISYSKDIKQ